MALESGTRVGSYEVTGRLGEGRMGVVYRARELKLGRGVALKVLPESFARDSDRLARFTREPHVLGVWYADEFADADESGGADRRRHAARHRRVQLMGNGC